jgi:outer membrane protein OmpA-like peptidoglycan-associated protein
MRRSIRPRFALLAAASLPAMLIGYAALAQGQPSPVQIFEEAPSLDLLRSIVVPESRPGLSRRIVLTNPDRPAPPMSQAAYDPDPEPARDSEPAPRRRQPRPMPISAPVAAPQPAVPAPAAAEPGTVGFRINFALDSAVVPPSAQPFVDRIAELMQQEQQVKLRVEGHTDALGSDEYNFELSMRRARAVAEALVERGVAQQRLMIQGKGETEPMAQNPYDAKNRRVQFVRVD